MEAFRLCLLLSFGTGKREVKIDREKIGQTARRRATGTRHSRQGSQALVSRVQVLTSVKPNGARRASPVAGTSDRRNRLMLDGNQGSFAKQDFSTG